MCVSMDCSIFWVAYPLLSQKRVKLRTSNFVCIFTGSRSDYRNKSPLKMSEKVAVGVVRDSRKFSWQRYVGRGRLCDSIAFLFSDVTVSIHNMFINLCLFQWQMKSTDTSDPLFFGER